MQFKETRSTTPIVRDDPEEGDDRPGLLEPVCRKHVGGSRWLQRCTRPDISYAVQFISRGVANWTVRHDRVLIRLMSYLQTTSRETLVWKIDMKNLEKFALETYVDSDHAGDKTSGRSTSGYATFLNMGSSKILLDWGCKRQTATSRSSGEAEVQAISDGLTRSCLFIMMLFEAVGVDIAQTVILTDSSAAQNGIAKCNSSAMRLMRKTHRVNLSWLKDTLENCDIKLEKVATIDNISDVNTKALHADRFIMLKRLLGVQEVSN